jgi:hypothetical protein
MPGTTTNFSWPTPSNGDPAQVAIDTTASLAAIDSTLGDDWTTFTTTWASTGTAVAIGDATTSSRYKLFGKWAIIESRIIFGATTTYGTGTYSFTIPAGLTMANLTGNLLPRGWALVVDSSTSTQYVGVATYVSGTTVGIRTHGATALVGQLVPVTFASGDSIGWHIEVELL